MLSRLIAPWRTSPPAIWGRLPGYTDIVCSGVRHGEGQAWTQWFAAHGLDADIEATARATSVPVAFALPPGTLPFARRRFVLGVIALSVDRDGRPRPLVIYQQQLPRQAMRHFEAQLRQPLDWQFWLARAVARQACMGLADIQALKATLHALRAESRELEKNFSVQRVRWMQALLDQRTGPAPRNDPAAELHGVRYLPWADWPHRLQGVRAESAFWQQDVNGRFIGAANKLIRLWSVSP
ncbi:type VI secretion system protein ImpM [Variovorax boronicumulans]|uniref:TagF domain-containing protein n=1 Tax=Variovorax boronicumulans TaxID=436515 RepID=UPI002783656B|nr:TagF domain-containing protein [Variovorax boronicumulans]MDQ0015744.1 type VI secretion system protein ImpM [Variovorax boronicumulans]